MILEFLINIFVGLVTTALGAVGGSTFTLPLDAVIALKTVLAYGNYVVGVDLLLIMATMVMFWTLVKLTIGFVLWVWKLLPLT